MPGVYISYPFCAQKCTYCNFASGVFPKNLEPQYQTRLRSEIERTQWPWRPETLYIGGGTPSLWPIEDLVATLAAVPGRPWREATLECAPGTLDALKIDAWLQAGINRVSLGVQSFQTNELRRTGRQHDAETVRRDVGLLRRAGLTNINLDLIAGLAGQTRASWSDSLDRLLALESPHVSVYILEVDEDSRLGAEVLLNGQRYGASDVPSEELQVEFYETAVARLAAAAIHRYEISNFARSGFESLHNLKYWRLEEYLGFGADAHSFAGAARWRNEETPTAYIARGESKREREPADPARERYWVGLRLSEGIEDSGAFPFEVRALIDDGLLERQGERVRLTSRGVLLSNEVFERFIAPS
jgi:oxygen-independent coproporphyrinogen-3 oxidase